MCNLKKPGRDFENLNKICQNIEQKYKRTLLTTIKNLLEIYKKPLATLLNLLQKLTVAF